MSTSAASGENVNILSHGLGMEFLISRQKWVARVRQLPLRSLSLDRITVLPFTTQYVVPRQIKPRNLELSIERSQSNLSIVFIFLLAAKKKT